MSLKLNTAATHLRKVKRIFKDAEGKINFTTSKSDVMSCGRQVNYSLDEKTLANFGKAQNRCKTCEAAYKNHIEEVKKLK